MEDSVDMGIETSLTTALMNDLHELVRSPKYKEAMASEIVGALELTKYQLLEAWHHTR